jgi:inosine/xanthosine triphosphate pyrophosphatase family protein
MKWMYCCVRNRKIFRGNRKELVFISIHYHMKFVTGNIHKWEEANAIIGGNLEMVALDLEEIQSIDIEEIITYKAKKAYELLGEPALCEDVGLFFDAWNGLP